MFGTMSGSSNTFGQSSNSPFGSPSVFGQNNNANNNPFAQKPFGSPSPFGAQTGGFIFGGTYTGVFGSSPVFGPSSTLAFWSSMPAFVASSSPAFGGTSAFGQEPAFGGFGLYTIIPAFYIIPASSTLAFGSSPVPAFGAASSPFGIGSGPAFGQSAFGSSPFGTATSAFGAPSSPFGGQTTTPAFGSPGFGQSFGQLVGSRITPYAQKPEVDSGIFSGKLESISVIGAYKEKSHEELRWEDYQLGDKGGPNPAGQSSGGMGFGTNNDQQSNLFPSSSAFNQMSSNLFSSTTSTDPFAPKTSTFRTPGFANSTPSLVSSPFVAAMSNPFASTPTPTPSVFGTAPAFASVTSPSLFGTPSTSTFRTSFGTNQPRGTSFSTSLNFANTQSSPLSQSSTPSLGQTSSPFRRSNFRQPAPAFSAPAFGASSTSAFGTSSIPAFGASSTPAFGSSPAPAFGAASSPFGFGSSPAFGQSASAFGSSPFGTATSAFGAPSSPFGGQATTPAFGSPGFGQPSAQRVGSRVTPYAQTPEADSGASGTAVGKLKSISAMPAYKEKSHEELRWGDYQSGDKGGPNPAGQSSGFGTNNAQQSNLFSSTSAFNQISSNPFSSTTSPNPFAPETSTFSTPGFANSTPSLVSSPFGVATSNPFASTPTPSVFGTTSAFASATSPSLFGTPSTSSFGTTSIFGTNQSQGTSFSTSLNFANSQSSPLFQSSTPSFHTSSPFG